MTPKTPEEIADKYCPCGSGGYRHQIGGACSLVKAIRDYGDFAIRADRERTEMEIYSLEEQIGKLATHITLHVEGEPSREGSTVDCAIRLLTELSFWRDLEPLMPDCPQDQNCSCLR